MCLFNIVSLEKTPNRMIVLLYGSEVGWQRLISLEFILWWTIKQNVPHLKQVVPIRMSPTQYEIYPSQLRKHHKVIITDEVLITLNSMEDALSSHRGQLDEFLFMANIPWFYEPVEKTACKSITAIMSNSGTGYKSSGLDDNPGTSGVPENFKRITRVQT